MMGAWSPSGAAIKSPSVRIVTSRYPSWYDRSCFKQTYKSYAVVSVSRRIFMIVSDWLEQLVRQFYSIRNCRFNLLKANFLEKLMLWLNRVPSDGLRITTIVEKYIAFSVSLDNCDYSVITQQTLYIYIYIYTYIYVCSIIHYGNINKDSTYLSYMYCTVLYYLHYTHYR